MPIILDTLMWDSSVVTIVKSSGRQTLWVHVDGERAALVHIGGRFLLPHRGWQLPGLVRDWMLDVALRAHAIANLIGGADHYLERRPMEMVAGA
ncbi:hypothetical protein [Salininema proteolyticum]|uniref:Uncharacterized protein n=1 Tax=Salininema proteolyticum TaxID=1607685 RepID=A0ABV8U4Z4_9ACTN